MKFDLENVLGAWKESRDLTWDLVRSLSRDSITIVQRRPGLNTLGMHLLEMADVTTAFADSLVSGKLDFGNVKPTYPDDEQTAANIKEALEASDKALMEAVSQIDEGTTVSAFGEDLPAIDILLTLLRHENLHHGQFIAFAYASNIQLPESWVVNWALPAAEK
jgi:uncharacterized damage-inducible protein DinB